MQRFNIHVQSSITMSWTSFLLSFRVYHTVLTVFVAGSLLVCDTTIRSTLHKKEQAYDVFLAFSYYGVLTFSMVLYHMVCVMDPGYVTADMMKKIDAGIPERGQANNNARVKLRRCGFCDMDQPLRARHCEECKRCVRKFDHHCPWFETCIGEKNHKYFLSFLVLKSIIIIWTISIVFSSFHSADDLSGWLSKNRVMLVDIVILIPAVLSVICLAGIHVYVALVNQTTWEMVSRMRISYLKDLDIEENPFHSGYIRNVYYFLCNNKVRRWEFLYNSKCYEIV